MKCSVHSFSFVQMPRTDGGEDYGYKFKCPISTCVEGIKKPEETIEILEDIIDQQKQEIIGLRTDYSDRIETSVLGVYTCTENGNQSN